MSFSSLAIVACVHTSNMASFLLGARLAGFTSGSHALFVVDTFGSFNFNDLVASPPDELNMTVDDDSSLLKEATQALFLMRSAPTSSLRLNMNESTPQVGRMCLSL